MDEKTKSANRNNTNNTKNATVKPFAPKTTDNDVEEVVEITVSTMEHPTLK